MSISTAIFPTLAAESALARRDEVRRVFLFALRMIVFLTVPASVGLIVLAEPVIRLFFERGAFSAESTRHTAFALQFYALGLLGHATVEIVDRVFYAWQDTWTPVRVALGAISANVLLSLVLMQTPLDYGGLALANAIAALVEGSVLLWLLSRRMLRDDGHGVGLTALGGQLARIVVAGLAMGGLVIVTREALFRRVELAQTVEHAVVVAACIGAGTTAYLLISRAIGLEEPRALWRLLSRR
jgi:putative peptidoglycan lipid II flippase